jgi:hypothetical protein
MITSVVKFIISDTFNYRLLLFLSILSVRSIAFYRNSFDIDLSKINLNLLNDVATNIDTIPKYQTVSGASLARARCFLQQPQRTLRVSSG